MKKEEVNVFIFRRDLRVVDNLGFVEMIKRSIKAKVPLLPIFIFNPDQIDPKKNTYFSKNCVEFMIQSLTSLSASLQNKLMFFHGNDIDILNQIYKQYDVQTIAFNLDYTPFARKRDQDIQTWCQQHDITCVGTEDYTLFPIGSIVTGGDKPKPYEVFTPFYNKCLSQISQIAKPLKNVRALSVTGAAEAEAVGKMSGQIDEKEIHLYYHNDPNPHLAVQGGREKALDILKQIKRGEFAKYEKERDLPAIDKTTKLSAYMKFGCVSVREVFDTIASTYGAHHGLAREIIWREFYANITYSFPHVLQGQSQLGKKNQRNIDNRAFKEKYEKIAWSYDQESFQKWCQGKTGVPLVDAAMRQMNQTGWMHNRCRMVVSMFLTKDLLIDWKMGEKYFARTLVDYDPSSNNGGWQWSASTGVDSQPYFRIFNPFTQSKRYDSETQYIKRWVPELKEVPAKDIHEWNVAYEKYKSTSLRYPAPMVDHGMQSKKAIQMFKVGTAST